MSRFRYHAGMLRFCNDTTGALEFTVTWKKDGIRHEEWYLGRKINPANDIFPRGIRDALEGKGEGESVTHTYEPRRCIPRFKEKLVRTLPLDRLRPLTRQGEPIVPRIGRFYPQGHINGLLDVYPDTLTPFRLAALDADTFTADCNHPLARISIDFRATIQYLAPLDRGGYGALTHWREASCDWGPGMQTMLDGTPTDFFQPGFFDTQHDSAPEPPPVDAQAMRNLLATCDRYITPGMRVMESPDAPGAYDAARLLFAVEYMTDPQTSFEAVANALPPGGPVVVAFTQQHDAARAIHGWRQLYNPFEGMGLVLEYLRRTGLCADAGTVSIRNDWRDRNDPDFLAAKGISDPIFVVYGHKA